MEQQLCSEISLSLKGVLILHVNGASKQPASPGPQPYMEKVFPISDSFSGCEQECEKGSDFYSAFIQWCLACMCWISWRCSSGYDLLRTLSMLLICLWECTTSSNCWNSWQILFASTGMSTYHLVANAYSLTPTTPLWTALKSHQIITYCYRLTWLPTEFFNTLFCYKLTRLVKNLPVNSDLMHRV